MMFKWRTLAITHDVSDMDIVSSCWPVPQADLGGQQTPLWCLPCWHHLFWCVTHGYCILVVAGLGVWPWRPADPTMVLPILISLVFMCHTSFVLMCHTWIMHHHSGRPLRLTLEASRPHHGGSHVDIIGFDVSHMDRQSLEVGTSLGPAWDQPKILVRIRKQLICLILTRPGPAWDQPGTSLKYRLG